MRLSDRAREWLPWLLLAVAVAITAAVYWPGLSGGWVFDDYPNIVDNTAIHIMPGHSTLAAWVNAALSSPASFLHRPLASITFAMNWYAGGGNPWPFKLTNVVIHLTNGVLIYAVLRTLMRAWNAAAIARRCDQCIDAPAATRLALVVSTAWMLAPINLLGVLYVVQRMESLCQVFVLGGMWAYLHGRWMMLTASDARRDRHGFALAVSGIVLGTLLGLTSKESAVLLPAYAFLAEWILMRFARAPLSDSANGDADTHQERRLWWTFAFTLFVPAVLGFLWLLRAALRPASWSGRDFTLAQRLLTEPRVLVDYLHWTLLPNPMVLSLYHDEIVTSTGLLTPWTTLSAILLLAALLVLAVWLRSRRPLVSLGIGWFFAGQLLTATIIPLELVYEQRMYFSSIGVLLAAGALLLGVRWRIALPILRGFLVAVALLWFAAATNLRAREWSNPLRLAIAEADRHPESARAVYEAGRLLLITSNFQPSKALDAAWKYLREAAVIPGSSSLPEQAMIMITDHHHQGVDAGFWDSMIRKLHDQPTSQEDISALISLTNCHESGICKFDVSWLQRAYQAALSRPHPIARLDGAYADFQRDELHDDMQAEKYLARAVAGDPTEPAYRIDLAALYARNSQTEMALQQIDALRRMNLAGRLDHQISTLESLAEQGRAAAKR